MSMVISRFSFSEFRAMSGWQVCDSNRRQRWWCDDILSLLASLSPIITVGFHAELPRELRQVSIMLSWHHSSWQRSISWHVWRVTWHLLRTFTKTMQCKVTLTWAEEENENCFKSTDSLATHCDRWGWHMAAGPVMCSPCWDFADLSTSPR